MARNAIVRMERMALTKLKPHPDNYADHPADQIDHIKQSITLFGVYRNIVVSKDNYILAGHGVVEAARSMSAI